MGICCSGVNPVDEIFIKHFKSSKLYSLDYESVKEILQLNMQKLELNEEFKMKINGKHLSALETSLNKISKDNFMKLAKQHFLNKSDEPSHLMTQQIYLEKICEISQNNRNSILLYIIPLLKSDKNKIKYFFESVQNLEITKILKYLRFKIFFKSYIKNCLIISSNSLKESLQKAKNQHNLIIELEDQINHQFTEENLNIFVDRIFEDFEKTKFMENDDFYMKAYVINYNDMYDILKKISYDIFDIDALRTFFLNRYW